jgi:hypothetical protein
MAATNKGFASAGLKCKLGALCFYSSSLLINSFVLRNLAAIANHGPLHAILKYGIIILVPKS